MTAHRVAAASLLLLALRLVVMATPVHMADTPMGIDAGEVVMMAELPPTCLLGAGDCSMTAASLADLSPTSASIEVGIMVLSGRAAPQLFEAVSHGPPRPAQLFPPARA